PSDTGLTNELGPRGHEMVFFWTVALAGAVTDRSVQSIPRFGCENLRCGKSRGPRRLFFLSSGAFPRNLISPLAWSIAFWAPVIVSSKFMGPASTIHS